MKNFLNVSRVSFAILTLFLLAAPTESFAQVVPPCIATSTFDTAATGTAAGKEGWNVINTDLDQAVVENTFGYSTFGCKSLRMSNAAINPIIWTQVFSPATSNAGELNALTSTGATGTPLNHFEAQFDIASVLPTEQAGLRLGVSPNRGPSPGDGSQMSALTFTDAAAGIDVFFTDFTGTTTENDPQIASALSRADPHTIRFVMDFIEGASNDIVQIFIDGNLAHTGTSWEDFYRFNPGSGTPTPDNSRTVNSLAFFETFASSSANLGKGFLIDNVSLSSSATSTGTTTPPASTTTPPVITLVGGASVDVVQNTTFVDPGFSAVDSASTSVPVIATGTVDTAVVGSYVITYTATDTNNNVATTTRTVNVLAAPVATSTVPVITLLGNSPMIVFINSVFSDPGATAISGTTTVPVIASGTVDTSVIGSNTILYTATGTNNDVATTTRIVNVISTSTPPTITLNGSSTIDVTINTTFVDPGATSSDAVGNPITPTATGTVNITALGTYTILYTATDTNNNVATTTRTVNVVAAPVPAPVPAPVTTSSGGGGGGRFFPPVPGLPAGFVFAPLTDQSTTGTTGSIVSPVVVGTVNPPTGQVTGQVLGASVFNFTRNLGFGSRGLDVMELQKILIASGHLVLGTPTQYFGTLTRAALRKWQTQHSIISTGFFGPLSRAEVLRQ